MKKLILIMLVISGCSKQPQVLSDDLSISVLNECTATVYFYDNNGNQYSKDIYDCEYVSVLRIKIAPGTYKVKAETTQGKSVTKTLQKAFMRKL